VNTAGSRALANKEMAHMVNKVRTLSVYIPKEQVEKALPERLQKLAKRRDRTVNYLVVKAIAQFLAREEKK